MTSDLDALHPSQPLGSCEAFDVLPPPLDSDNEESSDDDYDMKVVEQWRSAYSRRGLAQRVRLYIQHRGGSNTKGAGNGPTCSRTHRERVNQRVNRVAVKKWQVLLSGSRFLFLFLTAHDRFFFSFLLFLSFSSSPHFRYPYRFIHSY
jgi:hypothetical protein